MKRWFASGTPWIWLNAGALTISMVMVVGLLALITVRGLAHFWPDPVVEYSAGGGRILGIRIEREIGPDGAPRLLIKQGNRDLTGRDFVWHDEAALGAARLPRDAIIVERRSWGDLQGYLRAPDPATLAEQLARSNALIAEAQAIERYEIGAVNARVERLRLAQRATPSLDISAEMRVLDAEYEALRVRLGALEQAAQRDSMTVEVADGSLHELPLLRVVDAYQPNAMGFGDKLTHYFGKIWAFLSDYPREANTEGGIFPAIFGTVMMVMIMSVVVTPFGVLAAIYLREYAKQGPLTRIIRISVNNLAGVPSIVFGVFGLGFFVYTVGGQIDQLFYETALPAPTFGTPGLIWVSLTLALLTLPVVIVSTEEGLTRIPRAIREGSLALGATKAETLWKIVVPVAAPAMMTGLILAVARAAGEVAPLMLVGVVKLAPNLPVDATFPFLHLERKIMHLGFHIYDVGFQSPNSEAARPLVYATALVLVALIMVLNLSAIAIRNHLREKYRADSD